MRLAGKRLTKDGVIVIIAQQHRTQERNGQDARERLVRLIREAAVQAHREAAHQAESLAKGGWRARKSLRNQGIAARNWRMRRRPSG